MKNISKGKNSIYLFNAYSNLNPEISFISGSDRVGLKLIEKDKGDIVVIGPKIFEQQLVKKKVRFISSDNFKFQNLYLHYIIRFWYTLKILLEYRKEFKNYKIISTSDFLPDVLPAFLFSKKYNWYAFTYHLYPLSLNFRDFIGRFFQIISYTLYLSTERVVTTSSQCENFLKKNFRLNNIIKVPLGIDLDLYKKEFPRTNELIYLGRIKKSKGVFDLPYIISKIKPHKPDIKLTIVGNGTKEDNQLLFNLIEGFGVEDNFILLNNLDDSAVAELLLKSDILIQPSYEEGFGLSILEGLAAGIKIIAYNLPVYEEHFSNFGIFYVDIGEKDLFANEVLKHLQLNSGVKYSIQNFEKFSWERIFHKIFID